MNTRFKVDYINGVWIEDTQESLYIKIVMTLKQVS
jgi:hypothetical protein